MAHSLSVIDLSPWLGPISSSDDDNARLQVSRSIHAAILRDGFFHLTGVESVFSRHDMHESLSVARKFFARPTSEKVALAIKSPDGARGYQRLNENVTQGASDHHEAIDIYRDVHNLDQNRLLHGQNQLPINPPEFESVIVKNWVHGCKRIGRILMEATALGISDALGLSYPLGTIRDVWQELMQETDDPFWVLRVINYPQLPSNAPGISCGAHKDYGCYTLLHADDTKGALQAFVNEEDGPDEAEGSRGRWIAADPIPGAFVVNVGEMWVTWTNGMYKATLHRVIHTGSHNRISIPFFYEPTYDAIVRPLAAIVKAQNISSAETMSPIPYFEFLSRKVGGNFNLQTTEVST